ncbi:MAG: fused MFS/spermidine synthase [Vicinamibacterales bacterium]|nr:fused MFS/spermidine synthase [Vicinamibacterales bacterium]
MTRIFGVAMFLGAMLLFLLEPLFGRLVLPKLGGAPSVWNTCLVFFQLMLLAGYLYAWASARFLAPRTQVWVHGVLVVAALAVLPVRIVPEWAPSAGVGPVLWLLGVMTVSIGLPFLVVSTTAPVLQHWFSRTDHPDASDPYFLYQASNLGSMAGLIAYPLLLEPWFGLRAQGVVWSAGYALFGGLLAACGLVLKRRGRAHRAAGGAPSPGPRAASPDRPRRADVVGPRQIAWWITLAAIPSSLLLGVTTVLSTDVAVVPLLWVAPLLIYLATFVVAFARRPVVPLGVANAAFPMLVLPVVIVLIVRTVEPVWLVLPLHLLAFAVMALVCHSRLAAERPHADHLTLFYLCLSIGGALGGLFNALAAPVLFKVPLEYPIALVAASLVKPYRQTRPEQARVTRPDILWPVVLGLAAVALTFAARRLGPEFARFELLFTLGVPAFACFVFAPRPVRFGRGVAALFLASLARPSEFGAVLEVERSFFGVHRVYNDVPNRLRLLFHGGTMHGVQSLDPARARTPLAYYTREGPIGQVFAGFKGGRPRSVAVVGLGAGALAGYAEADQHWTFFEIDPAVVSLARDARYFSYLKDAPARMEVVLGDARTSLATLDRRYDLIVLDAFSSDAVPVHLLTREAIDLYLSRLEPGGLLAFHVSNRYLRLRQLFMALSRDAGLAHLKQIDTSREAVGSWSGRLPSDWILLARTREDFAALALDDRWSPLTDQPVRVWTDDYSNVLALFRWR